MDTNHDTQDQNRSRETTVSRGPQNTDLPDSPHDAKRLQREETILDLPDVSDIPGQEAVQAPPLGELADTTPSSADEEGDDVFDDASPTDETTR